MKTYYYVPTDEEVEPHIAEAKMWGIPIVHGIPDKILKEHPDITPSKAEIIKIPEFQGVALADSEINVGTHQAVIWSNEFLDLRGKTTISVFNARKKEMAYEDLIPVWSEKHRARWVFPILNIGKYEVSLLHDGEKLSTALFFAFKRKAAFQSGNKK
jgi:hypothetical protein